MLDDIPASSSHLSFAEGLKAKGTSTPPWGRAHFFQRGHKRSMVDRDVSDGFSYIRLLTFQYFVYGPQEMLTPYLATQVYMPQRTRQHPPRGAKKHAREKDECRHEDYDGTCRKIRKKRAQAGA